MKQNVAASSLSQQKLTSLGVRMRQHCQLLKLAVLVKTVFIEGINRRKRRFPSMLNHKILKNLLS
jgi:hypothetical protein